MIVDLNGRIIPAEEAQVSAFDHGLMYGIGLFETFRTYQGRPFLLDEHLQRLQDGCDELGILYDASKAKWLERITALLVANQLEDAYVRISVSAGVAPVGLPAEDYGQPIDIIYAKPLPSTPMQHKVLRRLKTLRNSPEGTIRYKSFHFMNNLLAKRELTQAKADAAEGVFLQADGYLTEGIVSNLFFVREDILYTPSIDTGILPGITRSQVKALARKKNIQVNEGRYVWTDLIAASEVFLTNSIQEIVPVKRIEDETGVVCATLPVGPITQQLTKLYREQIGG